MSRYVDWKDVVGRYQNDAKLGDATGMGSYWLATAEDEIDGFLGRKYTVPFSPTPGMIRDLCVDLTHYKMNISQESVKPLWEYIKYRIEGLLNGTIVITTSGTQFDLGFPIWVEDTGGSNFGLDDPIYWAISSTWMQNVDDARN